MKESLESLLMQLGLSGLEAVSYLAVLSEPNSTGYRISQMLGKAPANTYKALDSLLVKGAVVADDGGRSRTFAVVPVRELVGQMNHRLKTLADEIEKGLKAVYKPRPKEGVYSLTTIHQVIARAGEMVSEAKRSIVVDADQAPMNELLDHFREAAERGIKVLLHGRVEMEVPGCECIASVTEGWPGDMLVMIVDSEQYLISFMSNDMRTLFQAVWSRNFIASCLHRGYMVKALFYRISMMIGDGEHSMEDVRKELIRLWDDWGYKDTGSEALAKYLRDPDD